MTQQHFDEPDEDDDPRKPAVLEYNIKTHVTMVPAIIMGMHCLAHSMDIQIEITPEALRDRGLMKLQIRGDMPLGQAKQFERIAEGMARDMNKLKGGQR